MKLYRGFATVGTMTILSRVLGFARDVLIAAVLGTSYVADAFFVAFRLPNMFRRLFAEGAFDSAFIPLFARRLHADGPDAASDANDVTFTRTALLGRRSASTVTTAHAPSAPRSSSRSCRSSTT